MKPIQIQILITLVLSQCACVAPKTISEKSVSAESNSEKGYRRPITIEEAERKHMVSDPRLGKDPVPFGFINAQWLKLKGKIRPGDTLMEFYIPPMGDVFHPYAGIELVRDGNVIDQLITIT